ncbi:hypothetical protein G3I15_10740, partial [Streptomyces sp. SID10244]|nr:hypothetical protein [Streptomyces sp. SID10244]
QRPHIPPGQIQWVAVVEFHIHGATVRQAGDLTESGVHDVGRCAVDLEVPLCAVDLSFDLGLGDMVQVARIVVVHREHRIGVLEQPRHQPEMIGMQ